MEEFLNKVMAIPLEKWIESLTPGLIGLLGVFIGALLTWLTSCIIAHRQIMQEIKCSASLCLMRLQKVRAALIDTKAGLEKHDDPTEHDNQKKHYKNEKHNLGGDADRYLGAIARRKKLNESEFRLFVRMTQLLLREPQIGKPTRASAIAAQTEPTKANAKGTQATKEEYLCSLLEYLSSLINDFREQYPQLPKVDIESTYTAGAGTTCEAVDETSGKGQSGSVC